MKSVEEKGFSQLGRGKRDEVSRRKGLVSWREGKGIKSVGEKGLGQLGKGKGD